MRRCRWTFGLALIAIVWLTGWPLRAAVDPIVYEYDELAVEYVEGAARAVAASVPDDCLAEGGCECIADWVDRFTQSNKYRGNAYLMQFDSRLSEYRIGLAFEGTADLYFSIHIQNQDNVEYKPIWVGPAVRKTGDGTAQFYSSGLFNGLVNPEIPLEAGRLYALAVSWEDKQITHARDLSTSYPVEFASYTVLGHVTDGLPAGGLPLPEDQNISPIITRVHAFSMEVCLEPEPGACCRANVDGDPGTPDNDCVQSLETECVGDGWWFHGERSACTELSCDFGACCSPCNACSNDYTPEACADEGGAAHWLAIACPASSELLCPVITGACCTGTTCEEVCVDDCTGDYRGDGTSCDPNICSGACCLAGLCRDRTEERCLQQSGDPNAFRGVGTTCLTLPPEDECGGACCWGLDGSLDFCFDALSRAECVAQELDETMAYWGDGSVCNPGCSSIEDSVVGCCLPDGTCINTTTGFCNASWVQGDELAAPETCPAVCDVGACCHSDGDCEMITQHACVLRGGSWGDTESSCVPNDCTVPKGACCKSGGSCEDTVKASTCTQDNGIYHGDGTTCISSPACEPFGACCLSAPDSEGRICLDKITRTECTDLYAGAYRGDMTECATLEVACVDERRACCTQTGECLFVLEAQCNAIEGATPLAAEVRCSGSATCPSGACCLDDGTCVIRHVDDTLTPPVDKCSDSGGIYQGVDTVCDSGRCDLGACCSPDGAGGFTCNDENNEEDCDRANGVWAGDDTTCEAGACVPGACCNGDGSCTDNMIESDCTVQTGTTFAGPASECDLDANCPRAGACCLPNEACETFTETFCLTLDGAIFAGEGVVCDSAEVCRRGACCHLDGNCDDVDTLPSDCTAPYDLFYPRDTCETIDTPCEPSGGCCIDATCAIDVEIDCTILGGTYLGDGVGCVHTCSISGLSCDIANGDLDCNKECTTSHVACQSDADCEMGACRDGSACSVALQDCTAGLCDDGTTECTVGGDPCPDSGSCIVSDCVLETCEAIESCVAQACVQGACCLLDASCLEGIERASCDEAGGETFHEGVACEAIAAECIVRGACCPAGGGACTIATQADCEAGGDSYAGDAVSCDQALCPQPGACCDAGVCSVVMAVDCLGEFQGDSVPCDPNPCPQLGACCIGTTCQELTAADCAAQNGEYQGDNVPCDANSCVATGACCMDDSCQVLTATDCATQGGNYQGDDAPCDPNPCPQPGACCDAGVCSEVMEADCLGEYQGDGSTCDPNPCPQPGACCVGGACQELPQNECAAAGGIFEGEGVLCSTVTCPVVGAVSAVPAHEGSLWRSQKNIVRITFDANVPSTPLAGEIEINELLLDGAFGSDLSASFTFDVEGGTVLRIQDTGATLQHRKWYAVRNVGNWTGVLPFAAHYVVQVGDCDGNKLVISLDVGCVNAGIPCFINCGDDNRKDLDGDERIISLDVGVVNGHIGSFGVPKPTGH